MRKEEYKHIMQLIDRDITENNLKDLKSIRRYLDSQIKKAQENYTDIDENWDILTMDLRTFIHSNVIANRNFKTVSLILAIKKLRGISSTNDICVFDTIEVDPKFLLKERGLGKVTIETFEERLSRYGLSMQDKILPEDRKKLAMFREHSKNGKEMIKRR